MGVLSNPAHDAAAIPGDPEVVIVGAGCAGIAAAPALLARGVACVILEGGARVGGRAYAESESLGAPFDHGATWLHQAGENPLTPHAGEVQDHDQVRARRLHLGDRFATPEEMAEHDAACDAFSAQVEAATGPDTSVAEAGPRGGRWDATVAHWLGNQINAAPLDAISREDFLATDLEGPNLLPRIGVGGVVARLAAGLPVTFGARVERLRWDGPGVVAEGRFGRVAARAAIVTVSTGVLAAGAIRFTPELPAGHQDALHGLPMGLLTKLGFRATGPERLGLQPFHSVRLAVRPGTPPPFGWIGWPFGRDHLFGFVGGDRAWELARLGPAALEAAARADLAAIFGRAAETLGACTLTEWGTDPLFRGAYSHARPGHHASRAALAAPLAGGRLLIAGEACHSRFAGTVAGAWLSGEAAARRVLAG